MTANTEKANPEPEQTTAKFVQGSIPKHVVEMSLTGSVGLVGIFLVDLLDMYFLSLLGHKELAAAVGYAGSVTLFTLSICIGLAIATGIIQANILGRGEEQKAKQACMSSIFIGFVIALVILALLFPNIERVLMLLGASDITLQYAVEYLSIVVPTLPFLAVGLSLSFVLRSIGAAKSAMFTTLIGSFVNGVLDPIFIFALDLGIEGAAFASACSRIAMCVFAALVLIKNHRYFCIPKLDVFIEKILLTLRLSVPAVLTNFATPVGNAYMVYAISDYGENAIAGFAIIGRILPVAFAIVYALSGAIGPIVGQNFGAKLYQRIAATINFSYIFLTAYVVVVWLGLVFLADFLVTAFDATGEAKEMLLLFCNILSLSFLFAGVTFVGNAVFNNIRKPHYSTIMNWLKATVGTIPFVYIGSYLYGANGVLIGQAVGNIAVGVLTYFVVRYYCRHSKQT